MASQRCMHVHVTGTGLLQRFLNVTRLWYLLNATRARRRCLAYRAAGDYQGTGSPGSNPVPGNISRVRGRQKRSLLNTWEVTLPGTGLEPGQGLPVPPGSSPLPCMSGSACGPWWCLSNTTTSPATRCDHALRHVQG